MSAPGKLYKLNRTKQSQQQWYTQQQRRAVDGGAGPDAPHQGKQHVTSSRCQ